VNNPGVPEFVANNFDYVIALRSGCAVSHEALSGMSTRFFQVETHADIIRVCPLRKPFSLTAPVVVYKSWCKHTFKPASRICSCTEWNRSDSSSQIFQVYFCFAGVRKYLVCSLRQRSTRAADKNLRATQSPHERKMTEHLEQSNLVD